MVEKLNYRVEPRYFILRVIEQRSHVTSLFVPLSVEVIRHHSHPVQVLPQHWNVVTSVYDSFAGRYCS